ncbi:Stealth CR1 domain-containing protein [Furfurilactobacillus entadae]|uniref:Stealth CR1 domain-containing protein n=1 Tax=Furfurilactobacillus entadae TaxID=2922307 RepID=UPI0035EFF153
MDFPVDFVITWVNQNDQEWQKKYNKYSQRNKDPESTIRYRDYGTLKYLFRSIQKYAPWVHHVYVVTDCQVPDFLKEDYEGVTIIDHKEIIDADVLPTFNSNVIDLFLAKIPNLSEHFVYFNDDMFLNKATNITDFFDDNGNARDILGLNVIMPTGIFDHTYVNNMAVINDAFKKKAFLKENWRLLFNIKYGKWNFVSLLLMWIPRFSRFCDPHTPISFKKSQINDLNRRYPEIIENTKENRFRSTSDFSIWIYRYYAMLMGKFAPRAIKFGQHYALNEYQQIEKDILNGKHALININDADNLTSDEYTTAISSITLAFEKHLFEKSKYEK